MNLNESNIIKNIPSPELPRDDTIRKVNSLTERPADILNLSEDYLSNLKRAINDLDEYKKFQELRVNYNTFDTINDQVRQSAESPNAETAKTLAMLEKFSAQIKHSCRNYYTAVMRMELLRKQVFRLEPDDYKTRMENRDRSRRVIHNELISSLQAYTRHCNVNVPEHFGIMIDKNLLLTEAELKDRLFVGEWAFDCELGSRVESILNSARENKNEVNQ